MSALSPAEFIRHFLDGDTERIEGREVRGNVVLYGREVPGAVRALDVTFWGEVDISECRFARSLDLSGCAFAKTVTVRNSRIGGSLSFSDGVVRTQPSADGKNLEEAISLDLRGVQVEGDLDLSGIRVQYGGAPAQASMNGMIRAEGLRVGGSLDLTAAKLDNALSLIGTEVMGDTRIASRSSEGGRDGMAIFGRGIAAQKSRFRGEVRLSGAQIQGDLQFWSCRLESVLFDRPVLAQDQSDGQRVLERTTITGDVNLIAATVGYLDLHNTQIGGLLNLRNTTCGVLQFGYSVDDTPPSFGGMAIVSSTIDGDLLVPGCVVTGQAAPRSRRGVSIANTRITGDLGFWSRAALLNRQTDRPIAGRVPSSLRSLVHGDLAVMGCEIGGVLDLTNATVTGRILLDDTHVVRDVAFRSLATAGFDLLSGGERDGAARALGHLATRTRALSLTNLTCDNDLDLTGLELRTDGIDASRDLAVRHEPAAGRVDARDIVVKGTVKLFEPFEFDENVQEGEGAGAERRFFFEAEAEDGEAAEKARAANAEKAREALMIGVAPEADGYPTGCHAVIPGAIDLSGATIGELALSFQSFESSTGEQAKEVGLILANASLDRFTLPRPQPTQDGRGLRIPRPLDLRDVKVSLWNLDPDGRSGVARRDTYASVLDAAEGFRRSTYMAVESNLRNRGHSEDADFVYRRMVRVRFRRLRRDAPKALAGRPVARVWHAVQSPFAWAGHLVFDGLLGFGTDPGRLFWLVFGFWLLMLPAFLTPQNYQPAAEALGVDPAWAPGYPIRHGAPPERWSTSSGYMVSIEHHLPVVSLFVRDDWRLRSDASMCYGFDHTVWPAALRHLSGAEADADRSLDTCPGWRLGLSAEDWGALIMLLNWIAWPLLLAFAVNRLIRV